MLWGVGEEGNQRTWPINMSVDEGMSLTNDDTVSSIR